MIRSASLIIILAAFTLGGCASRAVSDCNAIAGSGWKQLSKAPPDRQELLTRANLPSESDVLWYSQGNDKIMVCDPSNSLVNPGCGGSQAYQFERANGVWTSQGVLLPVCKLPPT